MDTPKIIKADSSNVEEVKSAITLGFAADPLLRWFFPDPHKFLKNFAFWMDAFSKPALESDSIFTDENYYGGAIWHPPGIHLDAEVLGPTLEDIPSYRLESALQMFDEFDECHPKEADPPGEPLHQPQRSYPQGRGNPIPPALERC